MKRNAIVLGCGLVGATIARELADDPDYHVTAVDLEPEKLKQFNDRNRVGTQQADLSSPESVKRVVEGADVVLGALPSVFGLQTLKAVVEAGKHYCDISFVQQDPMQLDAQARDKGVTVVVDCGVAPGISNMIVGYLHERLARIDSVKIYVGGLPKKRTWPYQYKAPFSPDDIIEEYTRPARVVENGRVIVRPALSEPELIEFPRVGTLEACNTDGLRSLIYNIDAPNMKEKTLRYPGHAELMRVFRETGLFELGEVDVKGTKIRPRDLTAKLLQAMWSHEGEEEFTIMRAVIEGTESGRPIRHTYDLYDETDQQTGRSSMARTTGFPCVIVARMIADGRFDDPGVHPPEYLAANPGLFEHVLAELANRGVAVTSTRESIAPE